MEAKLVQIGEVVVVNINGRLDIDKTSPFKEACFKNLLDKKVVFNLQQLNFVGSTGIQNFFQALKEIHSKNKYGLRIAGMTADFHRLWAVNQSAELTIYDNMSLALQSFIESAVAEATAAPAVQAATDTTNTDDQTPESDPSVRTS
jgi:anti-anti-sigma factor